MKELELLTTKNFNGIQLDCYRSNEQEDPQDFLATREQIGRLLEYTEPMKSIAKIHERNTERLDRFSTIVKLTTVEGNRTVTREVIVYNFKGLLEICRYSNQPKANAVMDFLWEIADEIRRTGSYNASNAEPLNVRVRVAELLQRLALQVTSAAEREVINREAYKYATGQDLQRVTPTDTPRYWTAQQIGEELKWPADAVMNRAENLGITKKSINGYWDCETWFFSKEGRNKFLELVKKGIVKISDGFAYYESGYKRVYWSFDPCAAATNLKLN